MGYRRVTVKLATDYTQEELRASLSRLLKIRDFRFVTEQKSLDARDKRRIHWVLRVLVISGKLGGPEPESLPELSIPRRKRKGTVVIAGSGPAGIFTALVLQRAGFRTILLERGSPVDVRARAIKEFEESGNFNPVDNYAFGEGGAGTFSDGKLTSRSGYISLERRFILESYIRAGAPEEIAYLAHPHLGTDNLTGITRNLRTEYQELGGEIRFDTRLEDLEIRGDRVKTVITDRDEISVSGAVLATGHSAYDTYRMLIRRGVVFRTKNFALGCRVEHPQALINMAQWGCPSLPGVKAAEYRLTARPGGSLPVYTFCMCPGGMVIPAAAFPGTNIVNGMSRYRRDGVFANAACVAAVNMEILIGDDPGASGALDWMEALEQRFFRAAGGYAAPFSTIDDFLADRETGRQVPASYPLGIVPSRLGDLLPLPVSASLRLGLEAFSRKIRGFREGIILGLESKTSSPVQVIRDRNGLCDGFSNLYMVGEGSGWSGGIISSGADGIRTAMALGS